MKMRFGGVLAVALGTVLIVNGLTQSGDGAVGRVGVQCGSVNVGGLTSAGNCPTGGITITDTTPAGPGVPADWDVTITSPNCLGTDSNPVNVTVTVPTGGSAGTADNALYIFTNFQSADDGTKCSYTLTREANPAYTATFTPASPASLPFAADDEVQSQRVAQVTLLNEAVAASTTPTTEPPSSSAPATTASTSAEPTDVSVSSSAAAAPASDTQGAAPIAETGPGQPVKASLWLGIGLVLLGLFLCFEGRVRRLARHRS